MIVQSTLEVIRPGQVWELLDRDLCLLLGGCSYLGEEGWTVMVLEFGSVCSVYGVGQYGGNALCSEPEEWL